ncbi:sugar phosphate nucleotidyltransferase [Paenibacillus solanacearum]|nr:sugar phosphate nucleotidyltransferase [Paenibacillus solanacearum]
MNIIVLSGGSGTRLWPLSTEAKPKQFLQIFADETGEPISMLQNVWHQLTRRGLHTRTVIATSASQRELILDQIGPAADLVLEPEKRDTFPAILLSVAYLVTHRGMSREEPVVVLPVDSRAEDRFYDLLEQLPDVLEQSGANLSLIGVRPTKPSDKYGYMLPKGPALPGEAVGIDRFHEKPSFEESAQLMAQGALWNCGVFCFRAGYLLDMLQQMGIAGTTYEELLLSYHRLDPRSFDYAVTEREPRVTAIVYEGRWKDLGTWCALTEEMKEPGPGPVYISEGSRNVHVVNELDIPAVVVGLSDVVVAASREGILVTRKDAGAELKETLRTMAGKELRGGSSEQWSRPLDSAVFADGVEVETRRLHMSKGQETVIDASEASGRKVTWMVLHGSAFVRKNEETFTAAAGQTFLLQQPDRAVVCALEPLDAIEITTEFR